MRIPEDLVDFLESGVSILAATRDARLRPEATRACGAIVSPDRGSLTVFLGESWNRRAFDNLAHNGELAVGFSRPLDAFSIQIKGGPAHLRAATGDERSIVDRYHAAYVEQLYIIGLPRSIVKRMAVWPARAATIDVRDMFVQTPGPEAGRRLEGT